MLLYFYIYDLDEKKLTEQATEVIETAKMYRSVDGGWLPGKYVDRIHKKEIGSANGEYGKIVYISEVREAKAAIDGFIKFCGKNLRYYQKRADQWEKWTSEIKEAVLSDSDRKERT